MVSDVGVVRIRAHMHADLGDRIPVQRDGTLLNTVQRRVQPKSIVTERSLTSVGAPRHALLDLIRSVGAAGTLVDAGVVDSLSV